MKYAVLFEDNDEFAHMRPKFMDEHLQFLDTNRGRIDIAGPLKDANGNAPAGGLWIVDADNAEQVRELVEADPFWPTGLRKTAHILEWTQVFANGQRLV